MPYLLILDIQGDLGCFKKPYTTTSPLTYSIPPRTAITGILGAIIGIEKNQNNEIFNYKNANISVAIKKPIKKISINQNLIKTDNKEMSKIKKTGGRTQIRFETLKDVKYRLYIELKDIRLYEILKESLVEHKSVYTLALGLSEHLCNYVYVGEFEYFLSHESFAEVDSAINLDFINKNNVVLKTGQEYFTDNLPMEMKYDREITKYSNILFERRANKITIKDSEVVKISNGETITWI